MKKLSILLVILLVASLVLTACGSADGDTANNTVETPNVAVDESKDYSTEKLVVWSFTDEIDIAGDLDHFKELYTAEGKPFEGLEVEFVAVSIQDGYMDKILPALESGNGPDVFTGELDHIKQFIEAGYYADIESMMANDPEIDF